jgi:putative membrane protein
MAAGSGDEQRDPRVYMAAERTFLAWIRTALALMAFGFVVARFGVFLRELAVSGESGARQGSGSSLWVGLALIGVGVITCLVCSVRHARYVRAIDEGSFRRSFGSAFAFALVAVLALVGVAMAVMLMRL